MNNQKDVWKSDFGKEYTERNIFSPEDLDDFYTTEYGIKRSAMNKMILETVPLNAKILEVGCNVGNQLRMLQNMGYSNLYGIELQSYAVQRAKELTEGINIIQGVADDIPFKDEFFDLVFTSGVLIHIPPELHTKVAAEMIRCTKQYIWGFEYYSEELTEVNYRGNNNLLWKGNYSEMFTCSNEMIVVKTENYKYKNNDNVDSMYLLEKIKNR